MMNRGTMVSLSLALLACGCGASEGGDGNDGAAASSGAGGVEGNLGIDDPNATGGGGLSGGPLDEAAVQALRDSACAGESAATEPQPAVIQLIVDVSGSMGRDAPGSNRSKWSITRDALAAAIDALPGTIGVGVLYYPNMDTEPSEPEGDDSDSPRAVEACLNTSALIPIDLLGAPGSAHRARIGTSLDDAVPAGGTPTYDAFDVAEGALAQTTLPGNRFLLLITDGQPTFSSGCRGTGNVDDAVDPRPIIDLAQAASQTGVRTFVIGSPGSEQVGIPVFSDARTWLSRTASIGGTAAPGCNDDGPGFCHLDMTQEADFADALRRGLQTIVGQVVSCSYLVPRNPGGMEIDTDSVNVIFTHGDDALELIPRAASGDCSDGWYYSADFSSIELCESTCAAVKADPDPLLDVLFGCQSAMVPIR
jgi:hypothetical protein